MRVGQEGLLAVDNGSDNVGECPVLLIDREQIRVRIRRYFTFTPSAGAIYLTFPVEHTRWTRLPGWALECCSKASE